MAFKPASKQPQFADLKGILAQSKKTDEPLYQVVQEIIERLTQFQTVTITEEKIREIVINNIPVEVPITPTTGIHAITHEPGGSDPLHVDAAAGIGSLRTLGTGPNQAAPGNDVRFNDPSPPLPHAATHNTGGSDPITNIAETIIADGALLARNAANENITGEWTFVARRLNHITNIPEFVIANTAAALDEKIWRLTMGTGTFNFEGVNDAYTASVKAMVFSRIGNSIGTIAFWTQGLARVVIDGIGTLVAYNGLQLRGSSNVSIPADQTAWNPVGLGTVFQIEAGSGGAVNIRGILAQTNGYIVNIINIGGPVITFTHADASASPANRIFVPNGVAIALPLYGNITLRYSGTYTFWMVIAKSL